MKNVLIFGGVTLLFTPLLAFATSHLGSIVPDSVVQCAPYCQGCHLVQLFDNILRFAVYLSAVIATLMFAYAGFLYVTASTDQNNITKARNIFGKVFLGFVFVLAAWLIVNVIMNVFVQPGKLPWNQIQCGDYVEIARDSTPDQISTARGAGCVDCQTLSPDVPRKGGIGGQVNSELNQKLRDMDLSAEGLRVTEAYPPTVDHRNQCHYAGTCVDAGFRDSADRTAANISGAIQSGQQNGLTLVYEVETVERRDELVSGGVPPSQVIVVQGITAEHFSVYCQSCGS